jgi:hypothetical protein
MEFAAEVGFAGGHFAFVGFVVFTGEVEETVEDEDFYFVAESVAVGVGLTRGSIKGDGEIAHVFFCKGGGGREAEDVGGFVFAAEGFVEVAKGLVVGEEDVDFAAEADGEASAVEEAGEDGGGEIACGGARRHVNGDHGLSCFAESLE